MVTVHNEENKPRGGICVANHTSPIDIVMLAGDNVFSLVSITRFIKRFKIIYIHIEIVLWHCRLTVVANSYPTLFSERLLFLRFEAFTLFCMKKSKVCAKIKVEQKLLPYE